MSTPIEEDIDFLKGKIHTYEAVLAAILFT